MSKQKQSSVVSPLLTDIKLFRTEAGRMKHSLLFQWKNNLWFVLKAERINFSALCERECPFPPFPMDSFPLASSLGLVSICWSTFELRQTSMKYPAVRETQGKDGMSVGVILRTDAATFQILPPLSQVLSLWVGCSYGLAAFNLRVYRPLMGFFLEKKKDSVHFVIGLHTHIQNTCAAF